MTRGPGAEDSRSTPQPIGDFRYPGSPPFQDNELHRRLFWGRAREADIVLHAILSSNLFLLYSVSGLGKSSLLNAGVMQKLRERGHWPVSVRLNETDRPLVASIREQIKAATHADGSVELLHDPSVGPVDDDSRIWDMLAPLEVWDRNRLLQLVLIFDQFEELFTLDWGPTARREFIEQFGEVARGFRLDRSRRDAQHPADELPPPRVKFVIVIREDSLGELEALSSDVPQILENRFRLRPLDRTQADAAIREPALLEDHRLGSIRFTYTDAASRLILDFLRPRTPRGTVVDTEAVDPSQLQIVCQYIERVIVRRKEPAIPGHPVEISDADLGGRAGLDRILAHFYQRTLETIPDANRSAVRGLCERGLISKARRRLSLEEAEIGNAYRVSPATLAHLVSERLLRAEPRLDSVYFELSHDTLIEPILQYRDEQRVVEAARHGVARISTTTVDGVGMRAEGFGADVHRGLPADRDRGRGEAAMDVMLREIAAIDDDPATFAVRAELTVQPTWPTSGPTRSGEPARRKDEEPRLLLDGPALEPGEVGQIAVVEEDGLLRFVLPVEGTRNQFDIPLGDSLAADGPGERGLTFKPAALAIRVVGVLGGPKLANAGFRMGVRAIEDRGRPRGLRMFLSSAFRSKPDERTAVTFSSGPSALLLLHGINSSSHNCFRFSTEFMGVLERQYGGRVIAFDHATLGYSPKENAEELAELLSSFRLDSVDILAHSRGGLVARALAAQPVDSVHIRSIVYVATPNGGTPLAESEHLGQFLSLATNVIGLIPDNPVNEVAGIVLEVLREWLLDPVGELPGVAAMKPDSEILTELNQHPPPVVQRAIAAAFEPRSNQGALVRLRDLVTDQLFLGTDNDLLVPTRSTYQRCDQFHIPPDRRLVLDTSFGVCHSQFWTEPQVTSCLERWLNPDTDIRRMEGVPPELTDPAAELDDAITTGDMNAMRRAIQVLGSDKIDVVTGLIGGPLRAGASDSGLSTKRGTVVVLPGFLGSRLTTTANGREVWFSPWHLLRGRFTDLRLDVDEPMDVEVTGLVRQYMPLLAQLDRLWEVVPFAYDWRRSVTTNAAALADHLAANDIEIAGDWPVHFVGHSTGGLVARSFLSEHREDWHRGSGRLVQLGSPNWGSFAMPLAVLGEERLLRALAIFDVFHDEEEILDTLASFPGVPELFPSPERLLPGTIEAQHNRLYEPDVWPKRRAPIFRSGLREAIEFHTTYKTATVDRTVYVAGDNQNTPYRARVEADGQVSFGLTRSGDGRVAHYFGHQGLEDLKVFFVDSNHGQLMSDPSVLAAIDDLLDHGATNLLSTTSTSARAASGGEPAIWLRAAEIERDFAFGGRGRDGARPDRGAQLLRATEIYLGSTGARRSTLPPLRVRVVHGSLEQARHPVIAGRYKGIPLGGALGYIDDRFGGAVTELNVVGLNPDDAGTARYLRAPENVYPVGAILLGLGEFGSLTPDLLARAVERGTADFALASRRQSPGHIDIGMSAVLVGTPGRYGLTLVTSILATIRGVARASAVLGDEITIHELEIIELSEARALEAAIALKQLGDSAELTTMDVPIEIDTTIESRPGGRPGSYGYEESGAPWPRLMLEFEDHEEHREEDNNLAERPSDAVRKLRYVFVGRRDSSLQVDVVLSQIERHVRTAIQDPRADAQTNNTLFELLLPNDAKLELETFENLHLLVDESTAWIPWEMITGRDTTGRKSRPLALRAGLLRQLKPREREVPRKILRAVTDHALVIGDPPSDLPRLPGARQEANLVADALREADFIVNPCIYEDDGTPVEGQAAGLLDEFFRQHYRVIHVAGHGRFDAESKDPLRNGIVISADEILGPVQFRQRPIAPDLVFLNCCHIGRIDPQSDTAEDRSNYAHLAASLALELLRSGVTAVVAAGWAVNDRQASEFASRFYRCMLSGESFGEAVKEARTAAFDDGRTNTWAAYQCYGDPDFQLRTVRPHGRYLRTVHSPRHLINELKAVEKRAGDAVYSEHTVEVVESIRLLQAEAEQRFANNAEVWLALAQAYAEAGAFARAVKAYRDAITKDTKAERSVRTIDAYRQLANLEARVAAQRANKRPDQFDFGPDEDGVTEDTTELFALAEKRLDDLAPLDQSAEWHAIRGSLFKKRASTLTGDAQRDELRRSMDAYRAAVKVNNPQESAEVQLDVYHSSLTLLMAYALGWPDGTSIRSTYLERLAVQKASYDPEAGDYWERARVADVNATDIVTNDRLIIEADRVNLVQAFVNAFRVRSTMRNRSSVIDNYRDLSLLLPTEELKDAAQRVAEDLAAFRPPRAVRPGSSSTGSAGTGPGVP